MTPTWRRRIALIAPYAITAGVIAFLGTTYGISDIAAEMARGNWGAVIPVACGTVILTLCVVSAADLLVVRSLQGQLRYWDMIRAKAATSLLDVVNYSAGHTGYAVWIGRSTGMGVGLTAGTLLYVVSSDLCAVCLVASASVWLGAVDGEAANTLRWLAPTISGVLLLFILIGPYRLLTGGKKVDLFEPWSRIPRAVGLTQIGVRVILIVVVSCATWLAASAFGLELPIVAVLSILPVILVVGSLPINVAGFGAVQATWLLFTPWAEAPLVLAFQVVLAGFSGIAIILRGLPFVRRVAAEVARVEEASGDEDDR
jgi:hypothetical protein